MKLLILHETRMFRQKFAMKLACRNSLWCELGVRPLMSAFTQVCILAWNRL